MSKYSDLPTLAFVVLTAVVLTACDQGRDIRQASVRYGQDDCRDMVYRRVAQ